MVDLQIPKSGNSVLNIAVSTLIAFFISPIQTISQKSASEILSLPTEERLSYVLNYFNSGLVNDSVACLDYYVKLQHDFEEKNELFELLHQIGDFVLVPLVLH